MVNFAKPTVVNIGIQAITDYHDDHTSEFDIPDGMEAKALTIHGTVFGGGEANASGSDTYDFYYISVTESIDINIDGQGYETLGITFENSVFGSGNASSSAGTSTIDIYNLGTLQQPNKCVSIQRTDILTIKNDVIKLIDFGFAVKTNKETYQTLLCGSPSYMAPEIVKKEKYIAQYSDIWSLGVLLYSMLFGRFPFKGNSQKELFENIKKCEVDFPKDIIVNENPDNVDITAYYDGDLLIGFTMVYILKRFVFGAYFGVREDLRGKGYGQTIFSSLLKKYSKSNPFIMGAESPLEENAPNLEIRKRRHSFFIRNGMRDTGISYNYNGVLFTIMSNRNDPFSQEDFDEINSTLPE